MAHTCRLHLPSANSRISLSTNPETESFQFTKPQKNRMCFVSSLQLILSTFSFSLMIFEIALIYSFFCCLRLRLFSITAHISLNKRRKENHTRYLSFTSFVLEKLCRLTLSTRSASKLFKYCWCEWLEQTLKRYYISSLRRGFCRKKVKKKCKPTRRIGTNEYKH